MTFDILQGSSNNRYFVIVQKCLYYLFHDGGFITQVKKRDAIIEI